MMPGLVYLLEQAGVSLQLAEEHIRELRAENEALRANNESPESTISKPN